MSHDPGTNTYNSESGFRNLIGFQVVEWNEDHVVLELAIGPQHLNRQGGLHGGVLAAMIDSACGLAGCYCPTIGHIRKAMTLSLTTSFTGQAAPGVIRAVGSKRSGGRRIFVSTAEVTDAKYNIVAIGEATYRYISGSEDLHGVPL
jgi:uncharacterized protein (TIGR00369 family)